MENPRFELTSYTYDLNERLTQTGLANGGNEQRSYDNADRLTSVVNYDSLGSVQTAYSYVLDNVGNRTQMSDYVGAVTQYAYNQRDELLWEGVVAAPLSWNSFTLAQWVAFTLAQWVDFVLNDVPSESVTYTYDGVGNRLTMTSSGAVTTYSYDAANQLQTSVAPGGAVTTYSYDGAGNLVGENVAGAATSYLFDGPNRMTDVYPATGSDVTFVYDPDGRRVQKAVGAELTRFVWDGERLLVENDAANTPQVEYTQSDAGFGNLVSEYQTGSGSFQHAFDGLGSTGALLDVSGAVADRWAYSAFGLQETAPADEPTRLTFGGQLGYQYDLELDLYYCRNRYYDPVTGRWVNQDPAQADPINNYRYSGNNPVTVSDPSGLVGEELIPASYYRRGVDGALFDDGGAVWKGAHILVGSMDQGGHVHLDPYYAARYLWRLIQEQLKTLHELAAEMVKVMEAAKETGNLDEKEADRISAAIQAGYQLYAKLVLALMMNQRQLDASDPATQYSPGWLPDMDKYVPDWSAKYREQLKNEQITWTSDKRELERSIRRFEIAQTTTDIAGAVLGVGAVVGEAAKIGGVAGAKYLGGTLLKMAGAGVATYAAGKAAVAAGVNPTTADVGMRLAFLWIQVRAARTPEALAGKPTTKPAASPEVTKARPAVEPPVTGESKGLAAEGESIGVRSGETVTPTKAADQPFDPEGTLGAAKAWTKDARLAAYQRDYQLPTGRGKIRYIPPESWTPNQALPRGEQGGFLDKFGNEWVKGPSRTSGDPFEWDVQVGPHATEGFKAFASNNGSHVNVSVDGEITHVNP